MSNIFMSAVENLCNTYMYIYVSIVYIKSNKDDQIENTL